MITFTLQKWRQLNKIWHAKTADKAQIQISFRTYSEHIQNRFKVDLKNQLIHARMLTACRQRTDPENTYRLAKEFQT